MLAAETRQKVIILPNQNHPGLVQYGGCGQVVEVLAFDLSNPG